MADQARTYAQLLQENERVRAENADLIEANQRLRRQYENLRAANRSEPMTTEARQFDGEMSGDLEVWLGDAFMSWLPSKRQLLVVGPDGVERAVSEGDHVTRTGRVIPDTEPEDVA